MQEMVWIVPSRSRPSNIERLIAGFHTTRVHTDLLVVVDNDDPELEEYLKVAGKASSFEWFTLAVWSRLRLAGTLNYFALAMASEYEQIGFMGDDHLPRTPIWDGLMSAKLRKMKTGMVYANDLFQRESLPTEVCMTSDIIRSLGYMVPTTMTHLYLDNFWLDLGRAIGRIEYLEQIVIEHIHPHAGKAPSDAQYEDLNSNRQATADKHAYDTYKRKQFPTDVAKILEMIR